MNWKGTRVAVMGLARSGVSACLFLRKRGAEVMGTDLRNPPALGSVVSELQSAGVELVLGRHPDLGSFDVVVLSPGVEPSLDLIVKAREKGVRILPELELGALEAAGRIVCITGTKGKSTTTTALHAMLREAGVDARAVGNIGAPITAHVDGSKDDTVFVTEASSFQLETTRDFHAHCAVFLNLFADHLDRHPSFAAYAEAKARIFANQNAEDTAVVNGEDARVVELAARTRARVIPFRPRTQKTNSRESGAFFQDGDAVLQNSATTSLFHGADVQIPGAAVRANLLAAATAAHHFGVDSMHIEAAVRRFKGVPHTFEKLGEVDGIAFFNDSKATTLESVEAALRSFVSPVHIILGGRLKAGSFASLRGAVADHARAVYAIGESRDKVRDALIEVRPVHECLTLEEAVFRAFEAANPGDTILLSPGCSSFDMFRDYAERGEVFRRAFRELSLRGAA